MLMAIKHDIKDTLKHILTPQLTPFEQNLGNALLTYFVLIKVWNINTVLFRRCSYTLRPVDYIRQLAGSSMIHVMVYRLFGAKPLPGPMITSLWLDPWVQTSEKIQISLKYLECAFENVKISFRAKYV